MGIIAITFINYLLLSWLVTKPVKRLSKELLELPEKIEEEECKTRKTIIREDEIGDLEKTFYEMRKELFEKNEIIKNTCHDHGAPKEKSESDNRV